MSDSILVSTRKGLFVLERRNVQEARPANLDGLRGEMEPPRPDPALPGLYPPMLDASLEWITPGLGVYL